MNNLYNEKDAQGILERISKVTSSTKAQWGTMNAAQMMAHLNVAMQSAMGNNNMKRSFMGRFIGPFIKPGVMGPKPLPKSTPTDVSHIFPSDINFEESQAKALAAVKKFLNDGPGKAATHPHPFFGRLTAQEWPFCSGSIWIIICANSAFSIPILRTRIRLKALILQGQICNLTWRCLKRLVLL